MKRFLTVLFLFFGITGSIAQTGVEQLNEIDPRQYVEIYENTKEPVKPRLAWAFDTIQRKVEEVGRKSILRVEFNKQKLATNSDFIGNFSIAAEVNDRQVPVTPYSVIGQDEYQIGFDENSAKDNASFFLSMLIEAKKIDSVWNRLSPVFTGRSSIYLRQKVNELLAYYNRTQADSVTNIHAERHQELYNRIANVVMFVPSSSTLAVYMEKPHLFKNREITSALLEIRNNVQNNPDAYQIPARTKLKAYQSINKLVDYTVNYMDYFSEAGSKAVESYLSLIQRDKVFFRNAQRQLKNSLEVLKMLDTLQASSFKNYAHTLKNSVLNAQAVLSKLSDIRGTMLSRLLRQNGFNSLKDIARQDRQNVVKTLSDMTGKEIFKRLVYASIDLARADVEKDDKIKIYLKWYIDRQGPRSGNKPLKLHVTTFTVD